MLKKTVITLVLVASTQAQAGSIRKFVDSNGIVHFTNISVTGEIIPTGHTKPAKKSVAKVVTKAAIVTASNAVTVDAVEPAPAAIPAPEPTKSEGKTSVSYFYKYKVAGGGFLFTDKPKSKGILLSKTVVHNHAPYKQPLNTTLAYSSGRSYFGENKSRFNELIEEAANRHQVDARLLHAVIQTESAYRPDAVSRAGAVGLMQLMPDTARRFGVEDRTNPDQNVDGGTRYLKFLLNMFGPNVDLAVAAYNAGENAVLRHGNSIPPYQETQNYVRQVLALYNN